MNPADRLAPPSPLDKSHDRDGFDCGSEELDNYLKLYALQNQKKRATRTYVVARGAKVAGFYTLVFGSVKSEEAPPSIAKGTGRYPIPVLILARLAVDRREQGQGLGASMLKDALARAEKASEIGGLRAVLVHAKDEAAARFYGRFGFEAMPSRPNHLFLPLASILKNLPDR